LSLTANRGRTVPISFLANEDNGSFTSFVIDDLSVVTE